MINSGASHNFLSKEVVRRLGLLAEGIFGYGVLVGTGLTVKGKVICRDVELLMQGYTIMTSFLLLDLGNVDVILGIQWLETLGDMKVNWKLQVMKFKVRGDPSLCNSAISLKSLLKTLEQQGEGVLVEYSGLQAAGVSSSSESPPLQELIPFLEEFSQVFTEPQGLPPFRGKEHAIVLETGTNPVNVRPFRYPQAQKAEIEEQVSAMLAADIIKESGSPFSSPVLPVKKKDGSWRFCVDYRALNKVTVADSHPIPMIDQLLDELQGAVIFSKLDLRSRYHQILVKAEDVQKTAFWTHDGHYEFLIMPFGLTNAPATFQFLMNDIFIPYLRKFVLVFFDDILIYSSNREEHQSHLKVVLQVLQQHELYANRKKCQFCSEQIEYLGHVITADGVAADAGKISAMVEWPEPRNVKELRGFLGLT